MIPPGSLYELFIRTGVSTTENKDISAKEEFLQEVPHAAPLLAYFEPRRVTFAHSLKWLSARESIERFRPFIARDPNVTPSLQPLVPELDAPIDLPNDLGYARFRIKESSTTDNLCASVLDIRTPFQIGKYYNVLLPPPNPSWTGAMEFWKSRGGRVGRRGRKPTILGIHPRNRSVFDARLAGWITDSYPGPMSSIYWSKRFKGKLI